jgi:hypothetical protein
MSDDEKAIAIGRMVLERKKLVETSAALDGEVARFADGLMNIASRLRMQSPVIQTLEPVGALTDDELQLMAGHARLNELLAEGAKVHKRLRELQEQLARAGVR